MYEKYREAALITEKIKVFFFHVVIILRERFRNAELMNEWNHV